MKFRLLVVFLLALLAMQAVQAEERIAKVSVLASGELLLNGKQSSLSAIESEFKVLQSKKGMVYYYRENPQSEPPKEGVQVVRLIVKYRLPISMSSKPDFSDYIDENGKSHPRDP